MSLSFLYLHTCQDALAHAHRSLECHDQKESVSKSCWNPAWMILQYDFYQRVPDPVSISVYEEYTGIISAILR